MPCQVEFRKSGKKVDWSDQFESILELAEANGIDIDNDCRQGYCGSCMVKLASGKVEMSSDDGLDVPPADDFQSIPGQGVRHNQGREMMVGGPALLRQRHAEPDEALQNAEDRFGQNGQAAVYLVEGEDVLAVFAIVDAVRPESFEAVRRLKHEGWKWRCLRATPGLWRTRSQENSI
jgi:hypothetical protein